MFKPLFSVKRKAVSFCFKVPIKKVDKITIKCYFMLETNILGEKI